MAKSKAKSKAKKQEPKAAVAAAEPVPEEVASVFAKADCAPFTFATEEDTAVYAEVDGVLNDFQAAPSVEAFTAIQNKLVSLAGYPLVTAVLSGRYPLLFSSLKVQQRQLGACAMTPAHVADVDWDLWCRNTWLTNSCAVDDLGETAQSTLPSLAALLRRVEKDNDNNVNEVWSVLHVIAWALRSSAVGRDLVVPLCQCPALWEMVEAELVRGGRHTSLQLVLLDLLGALALHAPASAELLTRLCSVAGARAQFPHPVHFLTALKLYYACVLCDDAGSTRTQTTRDHLQRAWAALTSQTDAIPAPLRATEWVVGGGSTAHLAVAQQLHKLLTEKSAARLDLGAVKAFRTTAAQLPPEARAFCVYALPGNALLRLHTALQDTPSAALVTEVVATMVEVVLGAAAAAAKGAAKGDADAAVADAGKTDGYVQYCIQQLWMAGLSATLHSLLQRCDPAITAAVVRLLRHLAQRSLLSSAARRVLIGSPALSLVSEVLAGVAESANVKAELKKAAVVDVVEEALQLVCVMETAELTCVFADPLVFTVSTLISEGKDNADLLRRGLRTLAHLAEAFPMAGSMVLDFEFLMEQCSIADAPANASAALVVGSLDVMSAIVVQQPAAVTFEWIEMLLNILQNLAGWRKSVAGLDVALWRCVRRTVEASEDCHDYLFSEEAQEIFRNELERVQLQDDHFAAILPSLLGTAVCMQAFEHGEVNPAVAEALTRVPLTTWTADTCDGAFRFLAAAVAAGGAGTEEEAEEEGAAKAMGATISANDAATVAVRALNAARLSHVALAPAVLEDFSRALEEKKVAVDVAAALFAEVRTLMTPAGEEKPEKAAVAETKAQLCSSLLPLLHCIISNCPSARTEATAASAAQLLSRAAAESETDAAGLSSPELIDAALLLVNDACAMTVAPSDEDDEAKRTRVMAELWPSLGRVTQRAAEQRAHAGWQRVLGRVFGAAHAMLLGSSMIPFGTDSDPRLVYIGECGLPNVAVEPCNALLQTVLNYDDARLYLRNKYTASYTSSLEYMVDPAHNVSGVVPLSLQRYLEEARKV